jgi:hypothetical protein
VVGGTDRGEADPDVDGRRWKKRGGDLPGEEGIYFINTTNLDANEDDGEDIEANHNGTAEDGDDDEKGQRHGGTSTKANYKIRS